MVALRSALLTLAGVACLAACEQSYVRPPLGLVDPEPGALPSASAVAAENALQGTSTWYVPEADRADSRQLAVWASPYAISQSDTIDVHVHAVHGPVSVFVYRIGWYAGLGGRELFSQAQVSASAQPACSHPFSAPVSCPWATALRIPASSQWTSGLYLIKVVDATAKAAVYPFVVRDGRVARFAAVIPQFTWQAYNDFGGTSLYSPTRLNPFVSFERPYSSQGGATFVYGNAYSNERSAIRWLERSGYDVTYVSDVDLATSATFTAPLSGMLFIGHDEYWTTRQYDRVEALRDRGVHLAFLSGNNAYWNVRLDRGRVTGRDAHVVVCYKSEESGEPDPKGHPVENNTVLFRNDAIGRPENGLYGIMYVQVVSGSIPFVVASNPAPEARSFLAAAGLSPGDTLNGLMPGGSEGDRIVNNGRTPAGIQLLFRMPYAANRFREADGGFATVPAGTFHTTFFIAPSGAGVFASGTNEWGRLLDDFQSPGDARIRAVTAAVLDWMLAH